MLALGLAGGLDPVHDLRLDTPANFTYDAAAVLVENGQVVAAIEQARLDRIQRSNKFPGASIRFCLEQHGVRPGDIDLIAYYAPEEAANQLLAQLYLAMPQIKQKVDARTLLALTLESELGTRIEPDRLRFFSHKLTHAAGAMAQSGFNEALVLILDNSGGLFQAERRGNGTVQLEEIVKIPSSRSTTRLCQTLLPFLGLGHLDNQTAITMSHRGNPRSFREDLQAIYELLPGGDYRLNLPGAGRLLGKLASSNGKSPGQQQHDLAAALQETQEEIVLHILRHHRQETGLPHLCMAGGIVENSRTNGRVLAEGIFDSIFVHPSVTDAGCALGAALMASEEMGYSAPKERLYRVDWGTALGAATGLERRLNSWQDFLEFEKQDNIASRAASLLAEGSIVGWVQGRSEFSPRPQGNRVVLADPRILENRQKIDSVLFRAPGATALTPSILKEDLAEYFDVPHGVSNLPFHAFAIPVREEKRNELIATIDEDGTAWVQTVDSAIPKFWDLLQAFKKLVGVPVLLTTAFRGHEAPTVDAVEDAIQMFLLTDLDALVIGDFLVHKKTVATEAWHSLLISLPPYAQLQQTRRFIHPQKMRVTQAIRTTYDAGFTFPISVSLYDLLMQLDGEQPVSELLGADQGELLEELQELWKAGLIRLSGTRS